MIMLKKKSNKIMTKSGFKQVMLGIDTYGLLKLSDFFSSYFSRPFGDCPYRNRVHAFKSAGVSPGILQMKS